MLQPDLFFAYGLSSGLAVSAGRKLKQEKSLWVNKYFLATVIWLSVLYVPQIVYLLFRFPAWESMFAAQGLSELPAWLMSIYFIAVIVMGVLGFHVTAVLLKRGKTVAAIAQIVWSVAAALIIITVGWDGTGYKRLTYTGTGAEWVQGVAYPLTEFFSSPMFHTLLWLEGLVLIPYAVLFIKWARESQSRVRT